MVLSVSGSHALLFLSSFVELRTAHFELGMAEIFEARYLFCPFILPSKLGVW